MSLEIARDAYDVRADCFVPQLVPTGSSGECAYMISENIYVGLESTYLVFSPLPVPHSASRDARSRDGILKFPKQPLALKRLDSSQTNGVNAGPRCHSHSDHHHASTVCPHHASRTITHGPQSPSDADLGRYGSCTNRVSITTSRLPY